MNPFGRATFSILRRTAAVGAAMAGNSALTVAAMAPSWLKGNYAGTAILAGALIGAKGIAGGLKAASPLISPPVTYPHQGSGRAFGSGSGYRSSFKRPGGSMPAGNMGATGDLTLGLHAGRHG